MGGGASKTNHNQGNNNDTDAGECTSQQDSSSPHHRELRQHLESKESAACQDEETSHVSPQQFAIPKRSPRAQEQAHYGNNHEEEEEEDHDGVSYSPHSSGDHHNDLLDYRHSHEDEDEEGELDEEEAEEEPDTEESRQLRMLFAQSAMSMDMDNEDLIFNLLYFGGDTSNFASMMNNAAEETVAAHSAGNTYVKKATVVLSNRL